MQKFVNFLSEIYDRQCLAVVYTGFRGWGGSRQALGGGYFFTLGKSKISHFFKLDNFQKMFKKINENFIIF